MREGRCEECGGVVAFPFGLTIHNTATMEPIVRVVFCATSCRDKWRHLVGSALERLASCSRYRC